MANTVDEQRPDIPDLVWYYDTAVAPRRLTDYERQQVEKYFSWKFGIELETHEERMDN